MHPNDPHSNTGPDVPGATYQGYPQLERIALDRNDLRLGARRLLRLWYLAQGLPALVSREALFAAWSERGGVRGRHRSALAEGNGVYWENRGAWIRIFSPEEVCERLNVKLDGQELEVQERPRVALLLKTPEWHAHLAEWHLRRFRFDAEGVSDPVSRAELAASCGLSKRTVRRHLRRLGHVKAIPQRLAVGRFDSPAQLRKLREERPNAYLEHDGESAMIVQRLPDRFQVPKPPPAGQGRETDLGKLMRSGLIERLGRDRRGRDLWDGTGQAERRGPFAPSTPGTSGAGQPDLRALEGPRSAGRRLLDLQPLRGGRR